MNPIDGKPGPAKGWWKKCAGLCLACLILGFLLGFALDARYRPNHIQLYVNQNSKVSLKPKPGDIISWATYTDKLGNPIPIVINFGGPGPYPCENPSPYPPPTCVYKPPPDGPDVYLYGCTLGNDPQGTSCFDPVVGPQCSGCGSTGGIPPYSFQYFWFTFEWDIARLLNPAEGPSKAPQNLKGSTGTAPPKGQEKLVNAAPTAPPSSIVNVYAECKSGAQAIYPFNGNQPILNILAQPNYEITWNRWSKDYSISNLPQGFCLQTDPPSSPGDNQSCTINPSTVSNGTYPYTLTMACGGAPSNTQYIVITGSTVPKAKEK
jgi:hypothetical protein